MSCHGTTYLDLTIGTQSYRECENSKTKSMFASLTARNVVPPWSKQPVSDWPAKRCTGDERSDMTLIRRDASHRRPCQKPPSRFVGAAASIFCSRDDHNAADLLMSPIAAQTTALSSRKWYCRLLITPKARPAAFVQLHGLFSENIFRASMQ